MRTLALALALLAMGACSGDQPAAPEAPPTGKTRHIWSWQDKMPLPDSTKHCAARNDAAWGMRVPAGHSGYVAQRRMWIVVDTDGGGRGGRDLIWYEIYAPGDPMVMPDRQTQQVHEMVTFGDVAPWPREVRTLP